MEENASFKQYFWVGVWSLVLGVLLCLPGMMMPADPDQGGKADANSLTATSNTSSGVAASVNGVEIGEGAITAYVMNFRETQGLLDEADWASWLDSNGYTAEQVRADTVDYYINQEELRQAAASEGVAVDAAEVDEQIRNEITAFGSEEAWREALAQAGRSEELERMMAESSLLQERLAEKVVDIDVDDESLLDSARMYAAAWEGDVPESMDSLADVPDDLLAYVREVAEAEERQAGFMRWMREWAASADVVKNPMPEGLPYGVD